MYPPRSSVYVTRISLGSMINADVLSTSSRRLIFGRPMTALGLIGKSLFAVKSELMKHTQFSVRNTKLNRNTKHQLSVRNINVHINVQSPHKWWSTLKSAVFGSRSSLPPLVGPGWRLVCESVGKADLLSDHFDSRQSRESVNLLVTCHPSPSLITLPSGQMRLNVSC